MTTDLFRSAVLTAGLLAAPALAQPVQGYHGKTAVEHQAQFVALSQQGYRMLALTISGTTSDLRYAAVWIQRPGPDFVAIHEATSAQYQTFVDTYGPQGYTPTIITATGSTSNPRFAAVLELTNTPTVAYHGLTQSQFWSTRTTELGDGRQIVAADVYGDSDDPRFAVAFGPDTVGQGAVISVGTQNFQTAFDALAEGHARPSLITFNDHSRFLSLWRSDSVGQSIVHHGMTAGDYQNNFDAYGQQGMFPISLQASGSGAGTRYAAVWATTDVPQTPVFTATGPLVPELVNFDSWVQTWMSDNEFHAASLAIVKDARLVLARGYTNAPAWYPVTEPTDLFELASTTKPLTSIAIHQHFEDAQTGLDPTDPMLDYFPGANPFDVRVPQITIFDLLTHQGGWDRNANQNSFDPMVFSDEMIASAQNVALPLQKSNVFDFMIESQPLDFSPGTDSKYSNFGFSILGQVLEELNPGQSYAQIMQQDVFGPLGISRAQIGGSLFAQLTPNQVFSHVYDPRIANSVMSPAQPLVAAQYGDLNYPNMDSHGAWIMAAPDYAKVLAAFDLGAGNPLLGTTETADMWTVAPGYNTLMRGWYLRTVGDGKGGTVAMYQHNGLLLGSTAFIGRRADGISFVLFANGDKRAMSASVEGQQLSDVANGVSIWPNHDLFPRMGLPSLRTYRPGFTREAGVSCGSRVPMSLGIGGTPDLGQAMSFELDSAPAASPAFVVIGLTPTAYDLGPIGAPGCRLYTDPLLTLPGATDAAGSAAFPWLVPDLPGAVGTTIHSQAAVVAPSANTLGIITSHRLDVTLGGWL